MTKKTKVRMFLSLFLLIFAVTAEAETITSPDKTGTLQMTLVIAPPVYTISDDLQGGTVSTPNPTSYTTESEDFKLTNPTREGYKFVGWTSTEMTSLSTDVTILKGSSGNREYTAHWIPFATVTKAPEGITGLEYTGSAQELVTAGTAQGGTMVYALGNEAAEYSVSIPTGTDEGTYRVWYKASGDVDHLDSEPESLDVIITLKRYTITYDLGGGTLSQNNPSSYTLRSGDIRLEQTPTRQYYEFVGWILSGDVETGASSDLTINLQNASGNLTYIAVWKVSDKDVNSNIDEARNVLYSFNDKQVTQIKDTLTAKSADIKELYEAYRGMSSSDRAAVKKAVWSERNPRPGRNKF